MSITIETQPTRAQAIEASLNQAQAMGFYAETPDSDMISYLGFTTREEYLEWRTIWRARINALTANSRLARSLYTRRKILERNMEAMRDPAEIELAYKALSALNEEFWKLDSRGLRRERATSLLALRAASKREAARQWAASRKAVAA